MEVSAGHKQTDIGFMPDEWEPIAAVAFVDPHAPICYGVVQVGQDTNGGVPIVAIKYVKEIGSAPLHRTAPALERPYARSRVKCGDVLISIKGTIGRVGVVPTDFEGNISRELARLRPREGYSAEYIAQQFEAHATQARISTVVVGTTRLEFSIATLRKFEIPFPRSLTEQRAIAMALSDVDALLDSLEQLIAKKRDLKQAATQQLLTGQTRLPGFRGEWEVRRLGDVVDTDPENLSGETRPEYTFNYIALEDVDRGVLRSYSEQRFATAPSRARRKLRPDDVLVSTVRPNLQSHLLFRAEGSNWVCSTGFCVVRCRQNVAHPGYIFCHLFANRVSRQIEALLTGSSYPAINSGDVRGLEIPLPDFAEQTAIAAVLTDMDAELAALEARRDKTRDLKRAMMQELLTGKTRLVPVGGAHA